jgi:hypothetical protein
MANLTILGEIPKLRRELYELLVAIKKEADWKQLKADFKESPDYCEGDSPWLDVTIGCTFNFDDATIDWNYQTGDNSYTGGAYGHPEWFNCSLMPRTNCKQAANDLINEIHGRIAELSPLSRSWRMGLVS